MAVLTSTLRKLRHVASDPVLRRWLVGRATGRWSAMTSFTAHRPPYLSELHALSAEPGAVGFSELPYVMPDRHLDLNLAGRIMRIEPGEEGDLFTRDFDDLENYLALHRFAWLPLLGEEFDHAWLCSLWRAWRYAHGEPSAEWSWHPYTASERIVNILGYAQRHGLPGPLDDTLDVLGRHGPTVFNKLEYFGDQNTGNHLANNGRGLFLGGIALGREDWADVGGKILLEEACRIFRPSGILREGSSHYHLLLTRSYVECWLAARAAGRAETEALQVIARNALAVIPELFLPGAFPLIGDISPDCPPQHLSGLVNPGIRSGWVGLLSPEDFQALNDLMNCPPVGDLRSDGWLRADFHDWSGIWYAAPAGWSPYPGHGHQDCGGFELHHEGEAVFVDPGRGSYSDTGEAVSANTHNCLTVDGVDPYPVNRPYYDDTFRRDFGGPPPILEHEDNVVTLFHGGYRRLRGGGDVFRKWVSEPGSIDISDRVEGRGAHLISRNLVTTLPVEQSDDGVFIRGERCGYRVSGDVRPSLKPQTVWRAYGEGIPAMSVRFDVNAQLEWSGHIRVEAV